MKSPLAVRASEGSKYRAPSGGPSRFQWRGSREWSHTRIAAIGTSAAAQPSPALQRTLGPESRCIR